MGVDHPTMAISHLYQRAQVRLLRTSPMICSIVVGLCQEHIYKNGSGSQKSVHDAVWIRSSQSELLYRIYKQRVHCLRHEICENFRTDLLEDEDLRLTA